MSFRVSGIFKGTRALMAAAKAASATAKSSAVAVETPPLVFEINVRLTVHSNGQVSTVHIPVRTLGDDFDRKCGPADNRKGSPLKGPATAVASPTPSRRTPTESENGDEEKEEEMKTVVEDVNNQKSSGKRSKRRSTGEAKEAAEGGSSRALQRPRGMLKVLPVSPALSEFLGVHEACRNDAVKKVWNHIKLHNLQNPTNKKVFACDAQLKTIFDGKDEVETVEIPKLISPHFVKTD